MKVFLDMVLFAINGGGDKRKIELAGQIVYFDVRVYGRRSYRGENQ